MREGLSAPVPDLDLRPLLTMAGMGHGRQHGGDAAMPGETPAATDGHDAPGGRPSPSFSGRGRPVVAGGRHSGLAPYWFDVEATAYLGAGGQTAARLEAEYELLFTNRLVLQPLLEVNLYGKTHGERGIGAGVSNVETGLRLRYEIRREFAP